MSTNQEFESALLMIRMGLRHYAETHQKAYLSPIGHDGVLGPCWLEVAHGLAGLLNGETGAIDCGQFDRSIRALAKLNEFSEQEADTLESEGS